MTGYLARLKGGVALAGVAIALAMVAFWFLAFALYTALLDITTPAIAAAVTGVVATALAACAFLLARRMLRGRLAEMPESASAAASPPPAPGANRALAAELGQMIGEQAAGWTRTHPYGAVGAALAAGFAVGMSPELRRTLRGLIE